jgi:hypothetical protein
LTALLLLGDLPTNLSDELILNLCKVRDFWHYAASQKGREAQPAAGGLPSQGGSITGAKSPMKERPN